MPWAGPIEARTNGALVSDREGVATPYSVFHLQERGVMFIAPGTKVYEGMVIGEYSRDNDLNINIVREKKLTNMRASGHDEAVIITPHRVLGLEAAVEWIADDELAEITPKSIRLRKRVLKQVERPKTKKEDDE
jgi:GTP-binding protein